MNTRIEELREAIRKASLINDNQAPTLLTGTITDVKDPDKLGRCKVQLLNFGNYSTDWLSSVGPGLKEGLLPGKLVSQPVNVWGAYNSYEQLTYELLSPLVYENEPLPVASRLNLGLTLVKLTSSESWTLICQLRNGTWVWEPLAPLAHLHSPGDTMFQSNDSGGDFQQPIPAELGSDVVYVTTVKSYIKNSKALPPFAKP